jgi:hypothetical protein
MRTTKNKIDDYFTMVLHGVYTESQRVFEEKRSVKPGTELCETPW